jgi:hypothetical protein
MNELKADHQTPHGLLSTAWARRDAEITYTVDVPPGTKATFRLTNVELADESYEVQTLDGQREIVLLPGTHTLGLISTP